MRNDLNWDDLGRRIQDAVDWAVSSQNYNHLNKTIRQTVDQAVDLGSEAVRKAAKTIQYQPIRTMVLTRPSSRRWTPSPRTAASGAPRKRRSTATYSTPTC